MRAQSGCEVRRQWRHGRFVITTTNVGALRAWVGPADAIELIGKPFDLDEMTQALRRVLAGSHAARDDSARGPRSGLAMIVAVSTLRNNGTRWQ